MPISSGANNWPRTFWSRAPKRPGVHTNVVVVDRPNAPESSVNVSRPASPKVTYRNPSPPRTPSPPPAQPPPPETTTRRIVKERPPSPVRVVEKVTVPDTPSPPPPNLTTHRYVTEHHRRPPQRPPSPSRRVTDTTHYRSNRSGRFRHGDYDDHDSRCCANRFFSSGRDDATGCCQGGLMGRRRYPYAGSEGFYKMPGNGRGRCCALCCGILTGLLLLGLLAGLLGGLLPALQAQNAQDNIANTYPNGQYMNGIYYYPVTNPPDLFYLALGPGIPCNEFNNNSATAAAAAPVTVAAVTGTVATVTGTVAAVTSQPTPITTTLPNCDSITTSYVQVFGVSVSTTTMSFAQQFPAAAASGPLLISSLAVTIGLLFVTTISRLFIS